LGAGVTWLVLDGLPMHVLAETISRFAENETNALLKMAKIKQADG
jgi:hypothetical protein